MTDFLAIPPAREMAGELRVPPSKSATNRALLAAALTGQPVRIDGPLESDDTAALRRCLEAMGAAIVPVAGGLSVRGPLSAPRGGSGEPIALDAADSGTAARFLAAAAAAAPGRWRLTGSARLRERPVGELVDALRHAGARIEYGEHEGFLPLSIAGGGLESGTVTVDASRSSQFASALLLASLAVEGGLRVRTAGDVVSAPYVGMTLETLRALGHEVTEEPGGIRVRRGGRPADRFAVPGDYSSAVPFLAALAAVGGRIRLTGLRWPSADADAHAMPVLESMGLAIQAAPGGLEASGAGAPRPVSVRATDFPDAVPTLAAAAAFAEGPSRFEGIGHLRLKESDRLAAVVELLAAAGARAAIDGDALAIEGLAKTSQGAVTRLRTHHDHRMAMAAGILALRLPGILIENPDCVSKSYPGFFRDLGRLVRRGTPPSRSRQ